MLHTDFTARKTGLRCSGSPLIPRDPKKHPLFWATVALSCAFVGCGGGGGGSTAPTTNLDPPPPQASNVQTAPYGKWTTLPYTMPINPIHAAVLRTGKILVIAGSGNNPPVTNYQAALYDPQSGQIA